MSNKLIGDINEIYSNTKNITYKDTMLNIELVIKTYLENLKNKGVPKDVANDHLSDLFVDTIICDIYIACRGAINDVYDNTTITTQEI